MNWIEFFTSNSINYVTRGSNTKRGEASIKCPWCGDDDPSEHLGINLTTDAWGCLRNPQHRGKNSIYLIMNLLLCSRNQAELIYKQYNVADPDTLEAALESLTGEAKVEEAKPEPLRYSIDFRRICKEGSGYRFYKYLYYRGFDNPAKVANTYNLRYCTTGYWKDRIIFPVVQHGKLVAWTGRSIGTGQYAPRYLSTGNAIKSAIFNEDEMFLGGQKLIITEGPIDAIKIDYYAPDRCRATCIFGTSTTVDQLAILKRVSEHYKRVFILLDPEATDVAFQISDWLPQAVVAKVPAGVEDPGALSAEGVYDLIRSF